MAQYKKINLNNDIWVYCEEGHDFKKPQKAITFAFDTETQVLFDSKVLDASKLFKKVKNLNNESKRQRLTNHTWAWQIYDEFNGFFMTNDFETFLNYICACGFKFGWCYNATFDFAQIDYEILNKGRDKWKPHEHVKRGSGKAYMKNQNWTYESVHNDMGARYAYKLWTPYKHANRHVYTHAVELRDFMKLITGGLKRLLNDLDIRDNDGNEIRKLEMNYQNLEPNNLTDAELNYCANDVKGLYFAIKKFNKTIEEQSNNELHIYGEKTNVMTAGGFAKHELLRSLYPSLKTKAKRIIKYQKDHPLTEKQDEYLRANHLYRGGLCIVNEKFKGKLISDRVMYRYDVNSEYPYAMANINDLIGKPILKTYEEYLKMSKKEIEQYEVVYCLTSVYGTLKKGHIGVWFDPFRREFVNIINEDNLHLIFKREFDELLNWYENVEYTLDNVILWKKGAQVYKKFVMENYELKAQAKKDKNATLGQTTKLKLNSSYGKLAERVERVNGHYELNEQNGAIHFIRDNVEINLKSSMNVAVGALITAYARIYILSKIREICGDNIINEFVYIDTDSIHTFKEYKNADAFALGGLKLEATCQAIKYIAPKTYIDIEKVNNDGTIDYDKIELHSKGINLTAIINDLKKKQKGKKKGKPTLKLIDSKINYGAKYICLVAMNVYGGKVLIPTEKYLARLELAPNDDDKVVLTNYEGAIFSEI